jgi:hypothetical protein
MKKAFGLFNMVACYMCTIISIVSVTYYVTISHQFANAFILALAGFGMFMIAKTLHNEWRQGKL